MILSWLIPKKFSAPVEYTVCDVDGVILHEIDDVILLKDAQTDTAPEELSFFGGGIPAHSVGTIINIYPHLDEILINLEFNVNQRLAFAHLAGSQVRLHRRREEKLKKNA
jgi:hypothetical protein